MWNWKPWQRILLSPPHFQKVTIIYREITCWYTLAFNSGVVLEMVWKNRASREWLLFDIGAGITLVLDGTEPNEASGWSGEQFNSLVSSQHREKNVASSTKREKTLGSLCFVIKNEYQIPSSSALPSDPAKDLSWNVSNTNCDSQYTSASFAIICVLLFC